MYHCDLCTNSLVDPEHPPSKLPCSCNLTLCLKCARRTSSCPSCRKCITNFHYDHDKLQQLLLSSRRFTCPGCEESISARLFTNHCRNCLILWKKKLYDARAEQRKFQQENQELRDLCDFLHYQNLFA